MQIGCSRVISKPFGMNALIEAIQETLNDTSVFASVLGSSKAQRQLPMLEASPRPATTSHFAAAILSPNMPEVAAAFCTTLEGIGSQAVVFTSALSALTQLFALRVEPSLFVVVLDAGEEVHERSELIQALKSRSRQTAGYRQPRLIILGREDTLAHAASLESDDFLTLPIDTGKFQRAIERLISFED